MLRSKTLPHGWGGKTYSCVQGAEAADGEILLFLDADTFLEHGGLRAILETYLEGHGALSIGAFHRVVQLYEEFSAFFNLLMTAGTGAFAIGSRNRPSAGLFGPCLMVDRKSYWTVGGHAAVKDEILENLHLARHFREHSIFTRCFGGKGSLSVQMYPDGLGTLIQGWSKAFASGAGQSPFWILLASIAWLSGAILAAGCFVWGVVVGGITLWVGASLYALFSLQLCWFLRQIGSFRAITAFLYPIPLLFYQLVFARSIFLRVAHKKVPWKGRKLDSGAGED